MSPLSKSTIFFDESALIADKWSLELIAKAARRLLPNGPGHHIFIKLDHFMDSHLFFLVILGSAPNEQLQAWRATVIDEDTTPQFECLSVKK